MAEHSAPDKKELVTHPSAPQLEQLSRVRLGRLSKVPILPALAAELDSLKPPLPPAPAAPRELGGTAAAAAAAAAAHAQQPQPMSHEPVEPPPQALPRDMLEPPHRDSRPHALFEFLQTAPESWSELAPPPEPSKAAPPALDASSAAAAAAAPDIPTHHPPAYDIVVVDVDAAHEEFDVGEETEAESSAALEISEPSESHVSRGVRQTLYCTSQHPIASLENFITDEYGRRFYTGI